MYQSFNATEPTEYIFSPYILKEFRNRWFVFGTKITDLRIYNLALDRIISVEPCEAPYYENQEDGSCIFQIEVCINFEMYSVFMSYGPGVKIIYPHFAVSYMKERLKEAAALYDTKE